MIRYRRLAGQLDRGESIAIASWLALVLAAGVATVGTLLALRLAFGI